MTLILVVFVDYLGPLLPLFQQPNGYGPYGGMIHMNSFDSRMQKPTSVKQEPPFSQRGWEQPGPAAAAAHHYQNQWGHQNAGAYTGPPGGAHHPQQVAFCHSFYAKYGFFSNYFDTKAKHVFCKNCLVAKSFGQLSKARGSDPPFEKPFHFRVFLYRAF